MYPLSERDYISGIFVKEQIEALEDFCGYRFDIFNLQKYPSIIRYTVAQLFLLIRIVRGKYQNIHIHYAISGLFLLFYKPKANVIITFHGSDILPGDGSWNKRIQTVISKKLAKKADQLILVSEHMIPYLEEFKSKISVIPCGINLSFFEENATEIKAVNRKVIFPSNPERLEKNYKLFKEILEATKQKNPELEIEEICFRNMSREDIRQTLWSSDCLLLTSISEGSPQVVKEAMVCGLPIISRDVGNVAEMLEGVDFAFVSMDDNINTYVEKLTKILIERPRSANSKNQLVKLGLDNQSIAEKIAKIYA